MFIRYDGPLSFVPDSDRTSINQILDALISWLDVYLLAYLATDYIIYLFDNLFMSFIFIW